MEPSFAGIFSYRAARFLRYFQLSSWHFLFFAAGGTVARVIDLVTGLLIIRVLPPEQYAVYALMLGTAPVYALIFLSGILPAFWTHASNPKSTSTYLIALRRMSETTVYRQNYLLFFPIVALACLVTSQLTNNPIELAYGTITTVLLALANAHQAINDAALQRAKRQLTTTIGAFLQSFIRLSALPALALPQYAIYILMSASVIAVLANSSFCRRRLKPSKDEHATLSRPDFEATVTSIRRRSLPTDIFQAVSSQFYYWALAFLATPTAVAGYAALNRLGQVIFPLSLLFRGYFVPGFAQLSATSSLIKNFYALLFAAALLVLPIILTGLLWPGIVLRILGPHYASLETELTIYVAGLLFWTMAEVADQLLRSRGLFQSAWLSISIELCAFAAPLIATGAVTVRTVLCSFVSVALLRLLRLLVFASVRFRSSRDQMLENNR